jgi:hypothetical protein
MFRLEHCNLHKNPDPKLLILCAGVFALQWNQGVSLWKEHLLSRVVNVY